MEQDIELDLRGLAKSTGEVYFRWLKTKRLRPATVNLAIAPLRHLFATQNRPEVMAGVRRVREPARLPVAVLSVGEMQRLLSATTNEKHRAILLLLYCAGLRISELLALHLSDVVLQRELSCVRRARSRTVLRSPNPCRLGAACANTPIPRSARSRSKYGELLCWVSLRPGNSR